LNTAGIINIVAIVVAIIVHLLVILQAIPYTWINGGRSVSLEAQQQTSVISIVVLIIMALINIYFVKANSWSNVLFVIRATVLWLLFAYSVVGTVIQLIGTPFEKICMSLLCIVNVGMYFRLAIEKRIIT
jgi:hypothetical protein